MNNTKSLKRKLTTKNVQFAAEITVLETYSADEYDRSTFVSSPTVYKINPRLKPPQLTLDIPCLIQDNEDTVSSAENSPNSPPILALVDHYFSPQQRKKKKVQLSINTSICSDPLFFSGLSTNYKNDTIETDANDFLVPASAI
ncbi:hypothetical protein EDC96DRAFT_498778 [Choanephora cucurbitarum]|nr:hypothetical protein EDC96DRAFT_498778 [Choanephora cucurbitarum]